MKIIEVTRFAGYSVDTDGSIYTRYGPKSWCVIMGESEEPLYNCSEMEELFQKFMLANDEAGNVGDVGEESDAKR